MFASYRLAMLYTSVCRLRHARVPGPNTLQQSYLSPLNPTAERTAAT